jgi:FtsP/CotA-like multicopper oxidase with cupredoxin domain
VEFHRDLPNKTTIWGYRDLSPFAEPTVGAGSLDPLPDHILGPTIEQGFGALPGPRNEGSSYVPGRPIGGGIVVRHINCLPKQAPFGVPRTTVHLHGGHHLARADGFPENLEHPPDLKDGGPFPGFPTSVTFPDRIVMEPPDVVHPDNEPRCCSPSQFADGLCPMGHHVATEKQILDYYYPILDPGELDFMLGRSHKPGDPSERPSTQWYHDHLLDFTGPNAYRGLAGFVLCFDEVDSGNEPVAPPGTTQCPLPVYPSLGLPSAPYDIPLAIQDKRFDRQGNLVFAAFDHDGFLGDKFLVNGKIQPYLDVERRKYRFRVLNASNARIYQFFLADEEYRSYRMDMIATEGGLLSRPIRNLESFMIAMAERIEVIVDFSRFPVGTTLYLENRLAQDEGRRPDGLRSRGDRILRFNVVRDPVRPDCSVVPNELRPFKAIPKTVVEDAYKRLRTFEFERSHGAWVINGKLAGDLDRPVTSPRRGEPVIWRLVNKSGGWWHPIHIHSEFFRVVKRNGRDPSDPIANKIRAWVPGYELDGLVKKDTIILRDNDSADVFLDFRDHLGPFVFHCHNMEHEDMAMMARFDVIP